MSTRRQLGIMGGLLLLAGCGGQPASDQPAPAAGSQHTVVEVINHSSSDMDIYILRMGDRVRIGTATANLTTKFDVLPVQVAGVGPVRFLARPVLGGRSRGITSEPTVMHPGDVVTLDIPGP